VTTSDKDTAPPAATDTSTTASPATQHKESRPPAPWLTRGGVLVFFALLTVWPYASGNLYYQSIAIQLFIYIALAVSYQLLIGYANLVSFGHVAFFGISAYTSAVLITNYQWPVLLAWLTAVIVTVAFSLLVARLVLQLEPLLLSIATLAVALIVSLVVTTLEITWGEDGLITTEVTISGIDPQKFSYWFVAIGMMLTVLICSRIVRAPLGRLMTAVGDDATAARAVGTNARWSMAFVFALCSGLAGVAGIMQAQASVVLSPNSINLQVAITVLAMVAVGGLRSITGAVVGAVLLTMIPVLFAPIQEDAALLYGAVLLFVLMVSPSGIVGLLPRLQGLLRRRS
jgi:branched-chain amino acid transport system permease protein